MAAPTRVVANAQGSITDLNQLIDLIEGVTYSEQWLLKCLTGTDFKIQFAESAGATAFKLQNASAAAVFTVDSAGVVTLTGGLTLSGAANPTPTVEGQMRWDTDDNAIVVGDGAAQAIFGKLTSTSPANNFGAAAVGSAKQSSRSDHHHIGPTIQDINIVASGDITATTTTLADSGFTFAIAASEVWVVRYMLLVTTTNIGGIKMQITGPSAPTTVGITFTYYTAATAVSGQTATAFSAPLGAGSAGAATTPCIIEAYINNGSNAGNVVLQVAQNAAVGNTVIKKESWAIAERVA